MTPQELAKAYAETIAGPTNGWGQCVHPTLGQSDYIMRRLYEMVGQDKANELLDKAMETARK
jgi:hypothetical protein